MNLCASNKGNRWKRRVNGDRKRESPISSALTFFNWITILISILSFPRRKLFDLHLMLLQNVWACAIVQMRDVQEKALCPNVDVHKRSKLTDACFWRVQNMELESIFAEMSGGSCTVQMRDIQGVVHWHMYKQPKLFGWLAGEVRCIYICCCSLPI